MLVVNSNESMSNFDSSLSCNHALALTTIPLITIQYMHCPSLIVRDREMIMEMVPVLDFSTNMVRLRNTV